MVGIVAYGVYIPVYRLRLEDVAAAWGGGAGRGEKAVANFDEDSVTMAVAAGRECLQGMDKGSIDGLYFASTTSPYREKQASTLVATVLDLRKEIQTADYTDSLRAATSAIKAAEDAIGSGSAKRILVLASDCRLGVPGSEYEQTFGDGAVAFLIGDTDVTASIEGNYSIANEFVDLWRAEDDSYVKTWEDRFVLSQGYAKNVSDAVSGILSKYQLSLADFTKAVFYGPDARSHDRLIKSLGFEAITKSSNPLFSTVGNSGTAFAPMMLAEALEEAKTGDKILFADYGDGSDAFIFTITDRIGKAKSGQGVKGHIESKRLLPNYHKYLRFRSLLPSDTPRRPAYTTSVPQLWRDRRQVLSLHGHRCKHCGTVQFPMQRVCIKCQTKDQFDEVELADKPGVVFTYTLDFLVPSPDPPAIMTFIDFEGGGRILCAMTDADPGEVKIGMPVEMTFRRLHEGGGIHNYFWKCRPVK